MIKIKVDTTKFKSDVESIISGLNDREKLLRPVCLDLIVKMTERIHQDGNASDGKAIGEYSNSYLKKRAANNRGNDTKIIVSLTRQLENDWAVIANNKNGYGIGFNNEFNAKKAKWVEDQKDKIIFQLSADELTFADERLNELANEIITGG